jgi:hypothetical protein
MKLLAILAVALLAAQAAPPPPTPRQMDVIGIEPATKPAVQPTAPTPEPRAVKPVAIKISNPDNPVIEATGGKGPLDLNQLKGLLAGQAAALGQGEVLRGEIQADLKVPYIELAKALVACAQAKVADVTLNGFAVRLPTLGPPAPLSEDMDKGRIRVRLYEAGADGKDFAGGAFCSIVADDQPLGGDPATLRKYLESRKKGGMGAATPILIHPTLKCRCQWVLDVAKAARAVGFDHVQFAVPYE